jgi:hypothetical protein
MVQLFRPAAVVANVEKRKAAQRAAEGKKEPLPITGEPATEVVRAISSSTLAEQGAPAGKIAIALDSERKERELKKTRGF